MSDTIKIPKGDFGFNITFTVQNANGGIFVLTDYTIKFNVWTAGSPGSLLLAGTVVIDVAASGTCHYPVVTTNFDTAGNFKWELEMTKTGVNESTVSGDLIVYESG